MATEVKRYHTLVYSSPSGYQTNHAQIALYEGGGKTVAYIRFNDPGMNFENDLESGGRIKMRLPSTMLQSALDVLRNEKPVYIYFAQGCGFLSTSTLSAGISRVPHTESIDGLSWLHQPGKMIEVEARL